MRGVQFLEDFLQCNRGSSVVSFGYGGLGSWGLGSRVVVFEGFCFFSLGSSVFLWLLIFEQFYCVCYGFLSVFNICVINFIKVFFFELFRVVFVFQLVFIVLYLILCLSIICCLLMGLNFSMLVYFVNFI